MLSLSPPRTSFLSSHAGQGSCPASRFKEHQKPYSFSTERNVLNRF